MESKFNFLDESLWGVSGNLTQTLHVLLEYYKTESNMYRHHASNDIAKNTKTTTLQADSYLDKLHRNPGRPN
jgi:hypothetical protein